MWEKWSRFGYNDTKSNSRTSHVWTAPKRESISTVTGVYPNDSATAENDPVPEHNSNVYIDNKESGLVWVMVINQQHQDEDRAISAFAASSTHSATRGLYTGEVGQAGDNGGWGLFGS